MRKITKIKRSIRAISPIISVLLMIAIAVVASLVVYAWVMGYIGVSTGKSGNSIAIQSFTTQGNLILYVQNTGQATVHLKQDSSVYVNNVLRNILQSPVGTTLTAGQLIPVAPGQTVAIVIDFQPTVNQQLTIKVVTVEGTIMQTTGIPTTSTVGSSSYQVNFVLGTGGASLTHAGGNSYSPGTVLYISTTAASGYTFSSWTANNSAITFDSATSASTNAHIGGSGTITANFVQVQSGQNYQVNFVLGSGGASMSPTGTQTYASGSSVPISAGAAFGYQFSSWTSTGSISFDSATSTSTNAHIGSAGTVTANFVAINSGQNYQVNFVLGSGGASMSPTGTQTYASGSSVPLTTTAATGYVFAGWSSTGTITFDSAALATTNAHIDSAGVITANFVVVGTGQNYQVNFVLGSGGASMSPSGTQTYASGAIVPITVTASSGYMFSGWTSTGTITFDSVASASTNAHIGSAGTVTANFVAINSGQNYQVNFVLGSGGASMSPTGTQTYAGGSIVPLTATAASGYQFSSWSSTGTITFDAATSSSTNAHIGSAGTVTANFVAVSTGQNYQVVFNLGVGGASMSPIGTQTYAGGSIVPLTATAASGYQFSSWTNTGTITFDAATSSSTNAHIGSAGTVTANFVAVNTGQASMFLITLPSSATAGTSFTMNVTAQDESGKTVTNYAGTITFTSSDGQAVLPGASTLTSGTGTFTVTLKTAGSQTITAIDTAIASVSPMITVNPAAASKLIYTAGTSQSISANAVSSVITVQRQDPYNNPTTTGGITVSLTSSSTHTYHFYSDSAGNNRITSIAIADGSSSASFYYSDSGGGTTPTLTASYSGLTSATTQFTINSNQLVFTQGASQNLQANHISAAIILQSQTSSGNSHNPGSSLTVTLASTSGTGAFYSDAAGTQPITSGTVTITTATTTPPYSVTFYFKDTAQGTPTITASASGYTPATTTFTITGSATKLVFTAGASQSLYVNEVSPVITVAQEDANNHAVNAVNAITVNLTATSSTGAFYGSGGTGAAITSVTFASGSSSASFTYKDTAAGSPTITASSAGLTSATTTFTITLNQVPDGGFGSTGSSDPWQTSGSGYSQSYNTNDNAPALSGPYAEIDTTISGTGTASATLTNTFTAIPLSSIPNSGSSLSISVYNNAKGGVSSIAGYASFQIVITASNGQQLIYWWGNSPATAPTSTSTVKVINMGTLPGMFTVGQWVQFSRNLASDWTGQGLSSSASLTSIALTSTGILQSNQQYGQEIFLDNAQIQ